MRGEGRLKRITICAAAMIMLAAALLCLASCFPSEENANKINIYDITVMGGALKYRYAAKKVIESTVLMKSTFSVDGLGIKRTVSSTGVIVTADGYVLTNRHNVYMAGCTLTEIILTKHGEDYSETQYTAEVVQPKASPALDLALVKIKEEGKFRPVEIIPSERLVLSESVFTLGESAGTGLTLASAVVADPRSGELKGLGEGFDDIIKINANINQGIGVLGAKRGALYHTSSRTYIGGGSGLFNLAGELAGIVTYRSVGKSAEPNDIVNGIGYALRSEDILSVAAAYYEGVELSYKSS